MDNIDLHTLASSLPNAHQNAEAELTNNFKAAALSITTLYRSSKEASKRSYSAGYATACQDLMQMIQNGVSSDGNGMTVGRVMDWLEARVDAVKSREEEELEDEERTRRNTSHRPKEPIHQPPAREPPAPAATESSSSVDQNTWARPQRRSPPPSSPSPPPPRTLRPHRSRSTLPQQAQLPSDYAFTFGGDENHATYSTPFPTSVGVKRRHAMISMLDTPVSSSSSPLSHPSGGRRRTRSSAMEVEEEDRPRKRRQ